ncbi:hypothetical protein QUB63_33765 [Microcoleus sp. ARI1-B5]|uniref:DUF6887 family protein n=1 Tax=unclassified Microcoleus TaxID=2642155 RepID=UPI002FD655EB
MKPNFEEMSRAELKAYVLSHRDDDEAIRFFFSRRNPPDSQATWYGPMCTPEGVPIEENIRIAEEAIKKRVEIDNEKQQQRKKAREEELRQKLEVEIEAKLRSQIELEVEAKLRQKLETEIEERLMQKIAAKNQPATRQTTATVTQEKIDRLREQLKHDPEALAAIDTIQECGGNLEDAARLIAIAAGTEVESDLLEKLSSRCRSVICQDDLKVELPAMISAIAEFLVSTSGWPSRLATPIALFASEQGIEDFCDF